MRQRATSVNFRAYPLSRVPLNDSHFKPGSNRSFGLVFTALFAAIALWPLLGGEVPRIPAAAIALVTLLVSLFLPGILALPNRLWFRFGLALGAIMGPLVMGLVYLAVVLPTGLLMRLFRYDPLCRQLEPNSDSYWIERETPPQSMKNQF